MTIDINTVRVLVTVVSFIAFLGVIWFAMHPGNKQRFEEAARSPIDDLGDAPAGDRIRHE
jgi:cytochrome c oxidase cbb3-type subunit 4